MKYLKKFSIINEKSDENCDFDTFKDIMLELTDVYADVVFSQPEEEYYQCQFKLYDSDELDFDLPRIDLNSVVGYHVSDIEYSLDNDVVYKRVDDYINNLEDFKNNIGNIIEKYSKIKEVFKNIEDYILPRFKHFDNFQACSVGFDELEGIFIITFDTD
jgi:hypothetical protein